MITKLYGQLLSLTNDTATLAVSPFEYEVSIPEFTRRQLQGKIGETISLHTIHYIEGNAAQGSRLTPKLVGFLTTAERDFFELFCSVDGVGVKKALRAMTKPVQDTAVLIEQQDAKGLSSLPGVGPATAEKIIATLRRKMPRFALLVRQDSPGVEPQTTGVVEETFQALLVLGHSEADAKRLIDQAIAGGKKFKDSESMIHAIYQRQTGQSDS
ncbi:MAG: Holliday junction branch migration protein RuvA [Planctomycetota bacterium]|nr:helix-hairpin-helix domain-containing protein [Planctomycetaceae bacterium]